jgi:hypothetical protein
VHTYAPAAVRVGLETGQLSNWLTLNLRRRGLPRRLPRCPPRQGGAEFANQQDRCQRRLRPGPDRAHRLVPGSRG